MINLYGLGNIRDERLHRMWSDEKVHFLRLQGTNGTATEFEIQNENKDMDDIDEEENILPIDDGIEDAIQGIIENLIFDVDGIEIKSIKVTHDKRITN